MVLAILDIDTHLGGSGTSAFDQYKTHTASPLTQKPSLTDSLLPILHELRGGLRLPSLSVCPHGLPTRPSRPGTAPAPGERDASEKSGRFRLVGSAGVAGRYAVRRWNFRIFDDFLRRCFIDSQWLPVSYKVCLARSDLEIRLWRRLVAIFLPQSSCSASCEGGSGDRGVRIRRESSTAAASAVNCLQQPAKAW